MHMLCDMSYEMRKRLSCRLITHLAQCLFSTHRGVIEGIDIFGQVSVREYFQKGAERLLKYEHKHVIQLENIPYANDYKSKYCMET